MASNKSLKVFFCLRINIILKCFLESNDAIPDASLLAIQAAAQCVSEAEDLSKLSLPSLLSTVANSFSKANMSLSGNNNTFNKQAGSSGGALSRGQGSASSLSNVMMDTASRDTENKRSRTQLTNGQVNVMQATFDLYRSPSLAECEILGGGIGLARRVVQVCNC